VGLASVCGRRRQLVEGLFFTGAGSARTRQRREKRMMQRVAEGAVVDREQSWTGSSRGQGAVVWPRRRRCISRVHGAGTTEADGLAALARKIHPGNHDGTHCDVSANACTSLQTASTGFPSDKLLAAFAHGRRASFCFLGRIVMRTLPASSWTVSHRACPCAQSRQAPSWPHLTKKQAVAARAWRRPREAASPTARPRVGPEASSPAPSTFVAAIPLHPASASVKRASISTTFYH